MAAAWRMRALRMAGRIILENGGETYRAEDTVLRMAKALGLHDAGVFAVPSGLFISYADENEEQSTSVTRIHLRGTHLRRVDRVNQISRQLAQGSMEPQALLCALEEAANLDAQKPAWYEPLMAFVTAAGFAVMFGGGLLDSLVGGLCAAITQLVPLLWRRAGIAGSLMGSVFCALIPLWFHAVTGLGTPDAMIAAAIMPLVPGLSMTNAVQDILRGDMMSGVAHAARAVMVAALVAGGALIGTHLFRFTGLASPAVPAAVPSPLALQTLVVFFSSLMAGASFGALLYAPGKAIYWGGVLGGLGYTASWLALQLGAPNAVSMFLGAFIAAVGAQLAARKLKMIATIFVTIAILPLVPGLGLYRAMSTVAQGQTGAGLAIAASTMASILMIALGIGCGSQLALIPRRADHEGKG